MMSFQTESMLYFDSLQELEQFFQRFMIYEKWKITDEDVNSRGEKVRNSDYIKYFKNKFNEKGLFRRNVSVAELVSFVDNFYLMKKIIEKLKAEINIEDYNSFSLASEYRIRMSKNRRIDFILIYKKKILLIEFAITRKFPNQGSTWQKKETELLIYKELINNYIENKKIYIYAFLGMPEYSKGGKIKKNEKYNTTNIDYFVKYINHFLICKRQVRYS